MLLADSAFDSVSQFMSSHVCGLTCRKKEGPLSDVGSGRKTAARTCLKDLLEGIKKFYFPCQISLLDRQRAELSFGRQLHGYLLLQPRLGVQHTMLARPHKFTGEVPFTYYLSSAYALFFSDIKGMILSCQTSKARCVSSAFAEWPIAVCQSKFGDMLILFGVGKRHKHRRGIIIIIIIIIIISRYSEWSLKCVLCC